MVGWIPPTLELRVQRLGPMAKRILECWKDLVPEGTAVVLQYDSRTGDLTAWYW